MEKSLNKYLTGLSIALFVISLGFDAFYVGDLQRSFAGPGYALVATGWLGVIAGHFSWLANPLYLLALYLRNRDYAASLAYGGLALLFALSFLLYSRIPVDEGGGTDRITAYGIGYFLWLLSFLIFTGGRVVSLLAAKFADAKRSIRIAVAVLAVCVFVSSAIFFNHYCMDDSGHYKLLKERAAFFKANCSRATQVIIDKPGPVKGIYFDDNSYRLNATGLLNSGKIEFYEKKNDGKGEKPYLRYTSGSAQPQEVTELRSEYHVESTELTGNLRKALGIYGLKMDIVENRTSRIIATNTFFESNVGNDVNDFFLCGSYTNFLHDALNLRRAPDSVR